MGRNPSPDSDYSFVLSAVAGSDGLTLREIQKETGLELTKVGRIVHYFHFGVGWFQRTGKRFGYIYSIDPSKAEEVKKRMINFQKIRVEGSS